MSYIDFELEESGFGTLKELYDEYAIISAIKNILLSKPGNYPFTPNLGIDIEKYIGEIADDLTLETIKNEIITQIKQYIPDTGIIDVNVVYVPIGRASSMGLGIKIKLTSKGNVINTGILVSKDENEDIQIIVDKI